MEYYIFGVLISMGFFIINQAIKTVLHKCAIGMSDKRCLKLKQQQNHTN